MTSINISDYTVEFPYPHPYDIQKSYMEKVINCLHNKTHGVLESPTGTGKTLCLFAPVSAWARKQKELNKSDLHAENHDLFGLEPSSITLETESQETKNWGVKKKNVVWYTSRTHSQIAQTTAEIRRCNIKGLNIRVLGARDQLCINSEVLNEKNSYIKTIKCKELTKAKGCKYYLKLKHERDPGRYYHEGEVMDIEDLVSVGKMCGVCPYYLSKLAIETADIVLLPYNYIIDKDSRDANGFQFRGDVVIFDEGHNVPVTCEESYEFSFSSIDIALGIKNLKELMMVIAGLSEIANEDDEMDIAKHAENAVFMVEILQKLQSGLDDLETSDELLPVSTLYKYFDDAGIHSKTVTQLLRSIEDFKSDSSKLSLNGNALSTFHLMEKMMNTIFGSTVQSFDEETIDRSFKCSVRMDPERGKHCKTVSLYCFNPSFGIRAILQLGVNSIIITSGTLSPIRTFIYELNIPKPITLQNGHIAGKCQVPFLILGTGVNNVRMDAAFTNRNNEKYVFSLGMTLTNLISSVPDGVLLLFSSYSMMKNLREAWETKLGVWQRLNSLKRVFVEPRGKEEFINCMENYKRAIDSGNGAILMGVLRGKIAEGMDFKDQYCRGVFIVGVPFPPTKDPRVQGKEKYSDSLTYTDPITKMEQKLYKISYMSVEAMRATNQAIGRVIRHGRDYGAIVLVDYRFSWPRLFQNLSNWVKGNAPSEKNFPQAKKILGEFFRSVHLGMLGIPEVRHQRVDGNGCPIAGNINYEVYDHKTASRTPAPRISASVSEAKATQTSSIKYMDESFDNITSLYGSNDSSSGSLKSETKKTNSIFVALENAKSTLPALDEMMARNDKGNTENPKRKLSADRDTCQQSKLSCLDKLANSENKDCKTYKKISRISVRPFSTNGGKETEAVAQPVNFSSNYTDHTAMCSKNEDAATKEKDSPDEGGLKVKLINYFRLVKSQLNDEEGHSFKISSCRYMKGELKLSEMVALMDGLFDTREKSKLYRGFRVCVKSKDVDEWDRACRMRNIDE